MSSSIQELMSMGYSEEQATKALKIAGGDLEQAVGFLCLGEASQSAFNGSFSLTSSEHNPRSVPPGSLGRTTNTDSNSDVQELMDMGYSEGKAREALRVAHGDLDQAVSFLLMGESRSNFITDSFTEGTDRAQNHNDDEVLAAMLQEAELTEQHTQAAALAQQQRPQSTMYHTTAMNRQADTPKMVATDSCLMTPGASPYCACVAAARFLTGGVVTSSFLNSILGDGVELFRKKSTEGPANVQKVFEKYGKSHLGIEAEIEPGREPRTGIFSDENLKSEIGIRKLLSDSRNEQREGWLVLIMELELDSFLICLPPKGTKNKFWYIDFSPRAQFRVPGAYARVHSTLLQMEESLESVMRTLTQTRNLGVETFTLYKILSALSLPRCYDRPCAEFPTYSLL